MKDRAKKSLEKKGSNKDQHLAPKVIDETDPFEHDPKGMLTLSDGAPSEAASLDDVDVIHESEYQSMVQQEQESRRAARFSTELISGQELKEKT